MNLRTATLLFLTLLSVPAAARETYEDYWKEAHHPGVEVTEYPRATVIKDLDNLRVYIFTKPNNPEHPGVIIRKIEVKNGKTQMVTEGHSDGPDSAQPAFKTWMDNPFR